MRLGVTGMRRSSPFPGPETLTLGGESPAAKGDSPQAQAAALVWDLSACEAAARVLLDHGILTLLELLLEHPGTNGAGIYFLGTPTVKHTSPCPTA